MLITSNQSNSELLKTEQLVYAEYKSANLNLDMSRGKPCPAQLDLSQGMFDILTSSTVIKGAQDYRNYGLLDGIPEFKKIVCDLINVQPSELLLGGNSSLNLMYDSVQRAMQFGILGGTPFNKQGKIKWLCPVPGYDRHFAITETFGIEMINVPLDENGPDINFIKAQIKDPAVKGMWCVPKYSNPTGIVYSDSIVEQLATLKPAASDFRIYWDNAYMIHTLEEQDTPLLNILTIAKQNNNADIVYIFGSTSKITFAGGGIAFIASSEKNMSEIKKRMSMQTIGHDKINQFAHYSFFKTSTNIIEHMQKHAKIIKPKFDIVINTLETLLDANIAKWSYPKGGYFISCDLAHGTAKRTIALAKEAGVIFTPAGSTYPYGNDPLDSNVRIAPTLPSLQDLSTAMKVFCVAAKIAYLEKHA
ncbi:MAG: aminotransferase class I/II-fold pyridoxal phosphate-dependent enzyme [Christensenellaceae bacterium]|jgi:DNA-binding transcriptional MocR family regulator|nr:aminotransferase class I/II-fold pyridoxal phosphate-dependent enzyme [Christensenellaceae bacterium]